MAGLGLSLARARRPTASLTATRRRPPHMQLVLNFISLQQWMGRWLSSSVAARMHPQLVSSVRVLPARAALLSRIAATPFLRSASLRRPPTGSTGIPSLISTPAPSPGPTAAMRLTLRLPACQPDASTNRHSTAHRDGGLSLLTAHRRCFVAVAVAGKRWGSVCHLQQKAVVARPASLHFHRQTLRWGPSAHCAAGTQRPRHTPAPR